MKSEIKDFTTAPYFRRLLAEDLGLRQRKNANYSLRSYARDLGLNSAELSAIINGHRALPLKKADQVCKKLNLSPNEKAQFINSLIAQKSSIKNLFKNLLPQDFIQIQEDETGYKIIAEWEHFALISLLQTKNYQSDIAWMAQRLGVKKLRMQTVLDNLLRAGLIQKEGETLSLIHSNVSTTTDISSQALRQSYKEGLELAKDKIDSIPIEDRDFSSMTLTMDPQKMLQAKELIREFRRQFTSLMEEQVGSEVYQIQFQFFPLTNKESL